METKYILDENDLPRQWYNIQADLPVPPLSPSYNPQTKTPIGPADLAPPIFAKELIRQEVSTKRYIDIPPLKCGTSSLSGDHLPPSTVPGGWRNS